MHLTLTKSNFMIIYDAERKRVQTTSLKKMSRFMFTIVQEIDGLPDPSSYPAKLTCAPALDGAAITIIREFPDRETAEKAAEVGGSLWVEHIQEVNGWSRGKASLSVVLEKEVQFGFPLKNHLSVLQVVRIAQYYAQKENEHQLLFIGNVAPKGLSFEIQEAYFKRLSECSREEIASKHFDVSPQGTIEFEPGEELEDLRMEILEGSFPEA